MVNLDLPFPINLFQATWFLIGICLGRSFKSFDSGIQDSENFKNLSWTEQKFITTMMDFTHHFWIGMLLMVYCASLLNGEVYWLGMGLFIDDMPDIPSRFTGWFTYIKDKLRGTNIEEEKEKTPTTTTTITPVTSTPSSP